MPDNSTVVQIKGFKGLNLKSHAAALEDTELVEALNVNVGDAGELKKRTGLERTHAGATLGSNAVTILGHFLTDTLSQLIVKAGSNVYYTTNGSTFTLIGAYADASWGVQYAGNFYILRTGNVMVQWTGSAASNIAGSPTGSFGIIYKERMFVLNTNAAGTLSSRLYFSNAGDVSATGWPGTNFFDVVPGDGDYLVGLAIISDLLLIFKGKQTQALYVQGQLTDWIIRSINTEVGCISKYAIRQIQGYLYISSYQGIFRTDGAIFTDISQEIETSFRDRIVNLTTLNVDAFGVWGDQMICLISPSSGTPVYYVYHFRLGSWTEWQFGGGALPQTFTEVRSTTLGTGIYAGDRGTTGYLFRYGSEVYTDAGVQYLVSVKTKEFDLDLSTRYKRGKWIGLDLVGAATVDVMHIVDHVDQDVIIVTSQATRTIAKVLGPGYFRAWQIQLSFESNNSMTLLGMNLHMTGHRTLTKANT